MLTPKKITMQEILNLLNKEDGDIIGDKEMVEIFKATTGEENKEYNILIDLFLDWFDIPHIKDLRSAVSYIYLKCHLLEEWLITLDDLK